MKVEEKAQWLRDPGKKSPMGDRVGIKNNGNVTVLKFEMVVLSLLP